MFTVSKLRRAMLVGGGLLLAAGLLVAGATGLLGLLGALSAQASAPPGRAPAGTEPATSVVSPVQSSAGMPSTGRGGELGSGRNGELSEIPDRAEDSTVQDGATASLQTSRTSTTPGISGSSEPSELPEDSLGDPAGPGSTLGSAETVREGPRVSQPKVPRDKGLSLTVPRMSRVDGVPVATAAYDDRAALEAGALHPRGTGFPWEPNANVYIAGHRLGYAGTGSFLLFSDLNELTLGDAVFVRDALGRDYHYQVISKEVVEPGDTSVMKPVEGMELLTLQTCTLPNFSDRLIVRAGKVGP